MNKILILCIPIVLFLGCNANGGVSNYEKNIFIDESCRASISNLSSPTLDYTLNKDGEEYILSEDVILYEEGGTFCISLSLISGSSYSFSKFNIKSEGKLLYILDEDSVENTLGFEISSDGTFISDPIVYLKKFRT